MQNRCAKSDDVSDVDQKFIVNMNFTILLCGRTVKIPDYDQILKKFQLYQELYMNWFSADEPLLVNFLFFRKETEFWSVWPLWINITLTNSTVTFTYEVYYLVEKENI